MSILATIVGVIIVGAIIIHFSGEISDGIRDPDGAKEKMEIYRRKYERYSDKDLFDTFKRSGLDLKERYVISQILKERGYENNHSEDE